MNFQSEARPQFDDSDAVLRWIHCDLSDSELAPALRDARCRLKRCAAWMQTSLRPLVVYRSGEPVAASYFKLLCGNVAMLGGVRAAAGHSHTAAKLVRWQVDKLRQTAVAQIQAVVRPDDSATAELLALTGFEKLTCVEQHWTDVSRPTSKTIARDLSNAEQGFYREADCELNTLPAKSIPNDEDRATVNWRPADHFARDRMAHIIDSTFVDTLDCPAMNGRRSPQEVLDGFLDGLKLRQTAPWWEIVEIDGRIAGCLLLQQHSAELIELVYMGLLPFARGQGLGRAMVRRAVNAAHRLGGQTLVVAVDEQNWPALSVYRQSGFRIHQRLEVWVTD